MSYAFRNQPIKGVYLTYQLLSTLFLRVPLWIVLGIPKSWRPRQSWSLGRTLIVKLLRHLTFIMTQAGPLTKTPNHLAIVPDVNGVWVDPVPHLIVGDLKIWATAASASSIRIPGYWMHKNGTQIEVASRPQPGEKVIYALHGGSYVRLSGNPKDVTANIARGFLQHTRPVNRVFSIEYRVSAAKPFAPAAPFPTALIDALAGYNYLVNDIGFASSDIIIEGDSAGGNLAHALTRYLTESKDTTEGKIPSPPGALILLSPWCDLGSKTHAWPTDMPPPCDIIGEPTSPAFDYAKSAFLGPHGLGFAEHNRYVSPSASDPKFKITFSGFPRTFIVAGGAEILLPQIRFLKDRMVKDLGAGNGVKEGEGMVRYYEDPDGIHDYLVFSWHEPARTRTLKAIAEWIDAA